ncbi:MAG: NHL repeat-containing protein [Candidatus Eisenbacteria bacterium]|uniref:NHL repeat-containing protein n=1 Tax=Eiseniibacteriota bacterium TaxID=2212470 RepID=A0A933SFM7_UNCEI|nr:NHL repeat-containing protein [Candidatus Eisenbacteria bacterium]
MAPTFTNPISRRIPAPAALILPGVVLVMSLLSPVGHAVPVASALGEPAEPQVDSMLIQADANGGREFESPLGVAIDAGAEEIVVANSGLNRIEFFGADGHPHGYFVHRVFDATGTERDGLPKHVAVDSRGRVLVVDAFASYVNICDFRGRSVGRIEMPAPDNDLNSGHGPGPIAVGPDGRIYVAARGKQGRIHVFDADGKWQTTWGETGNKPGQLAAITGIGVAPNGEVFVCCVSTELGVQVFDAKGAYLRGFGVHDIGPGRFSQPTSLVVTPEGRVWVTDNVRHNIQVFDLTGKLLGVLGGGDGPGAILYPSALASDGKGMFALVETGGKRLRLMWVR